MLIGLLVAYLFLGGSHQTFLLNPNMEKNVSEYVKDKSRKDQIDRIIKEVKKAEVDFQKKIEKPVGKKLEDLNMNRASTKNDFNNEYTLLYDSLIDLQNLCTNSEFKVRSLILSNEWDSIMNKVLKQPSSDKLRKKMYAENKKLHDRLLKACNNHIPDSINRKKAKSYVDVYLTKGNTLANSFLDLNYKYISGIRQYTAARDDFEKPEKQMIELRKNYSNYLVDTRFNLMALTTEKEWTGVAKVLNDDFNYLGAGAER
jgi:hypothetical protein